MAKDYIKNLESSMDYEISSDQQNLIINSTVLTNDMSQNKRAWIVCLTAALFFFYEFVQLNMLNAISSDLMREFAIAPVELGIFSASFFYANAIFLLPAGILLDRYSTRKLLIMAICFCVAGTLLFAVAYSLPLATLGRFITGLCNAFAFLACMRLAVRWFPPRKLALVTGVIVTLGMIGGMVAQTPFTLLAQHFGWRNTLILDAFVGLFVAIIIARYVTDYPTQHAYCYLKEKEQLKGIGFWKSLSLSAINPQNWLAGLYTCFTNLPISLLGALWGNLYLTQAHHLTATQASITSMMLFVGMIIGSPAIGWFSDTVQQRKKPMIVGSFILTLILLPTIYLQQLSLPILMLSFFTLGFCASIQVVGYSYITEVNPSVIMSTSMSFASVILFVGSAILQPLFGWLMNSHLINFNETKTFQVALTLLPLAALISILIAMFFRERPVKTKAIRTE